MKIQRTIIIITLVFVVYQITLQLPFHLSAQKAPVFDNS